MDHFLLLLLSHSLSLSLFLSLALLPHLPNMVNFFTTVVGIFKRFFGATIELAPLFGFVFWLQIRDAGYSVCDPSPMSYHAPHRTVPDR